jgi:uncharacterized repeat protein (TIGR03803 family)
MLSSWFTVLGLAIVVALAPAQSCAATPTLTTLVSFDSTDIPIPTGLVVDASGNLFGTAPSGGAYGYGAVIEIAKTTKGYTLTTLYNFCAQAGCIDGAFPLTGLVVDTNGNLLGTTRAGGAAYIQDGSVFEIAKTSSGYAKAITTLFSFGLNVSASPSSGLIADAKGNLFGTAITSGASLVFEVTKASSGYASTPTWLPDLLCEGSAGRLTVDADGNLFGATNQIRPFCNQFGSVVEIAKTSSGYSNPTTLYSFCAQPGCIDGAYPTAGLVVDANGNLFGTAGGGAYGYGMVFEIAKGSSGYASTPTTLYSFDGTDFAGPSGLVVDVNGNLFGTASHGGAYGYGTVFEIAKTTNGYANTPTILVSFNLADGAYPGGLVADANGNLFGTTGVGTVFEITGSGFVVPVTLAGTPGKANCHGKSVSALARKYGGLNGAAAALGYASVETLQNAILDFCEG